MKPRYAAFAALDPFFELVQRGLSGLVDGEHYFDMIAEKAIFEFRYDFPGWPRRIEGRDALIDITKSNAVIHQRFLWISDRLRLYQIIWVGRGKTGTTPDVEAFLDSFRMIK